MNQERREILFDLLAKKAVYGLNEAEQNELKEFDTDTAEAEFRSLEITAAAIGMAGLDADEPLPLHLRSTIIDNAGSYLRTSNADATAETPWPPPDKTYENTARFGNGSGGSIFGWLGWAVAAAACILLGVNIWFTWQKPKEVAVNMQPQNTPQMLTPAQKRDALLASPGITRATWAAGNVKEMKQVSGDVVWSDEKQEGYLRFQGLPVNDATATCYQLWIFDKTQDKATPIDGGIFDVADGGEIVIPIKAKLTAQKPEMFALTIERHGGVVVSKREKIAALAKVETKTG